MDVNKENDLSIRDDRKESLAERLRELIGARSARSAAADWGVSFSTLNNYLNRGTEPSFFIMQKIAAKEGVSLDWIAYGSLELNKTQSSSCDEPQNTAIPKLNEETLKATWIMVYESLSRDEIHSLMMLIVKEGAKGILTISDRSESVDRTFSRLSNEEKLRLLALHESYEKAKKGAPEGGVVDTLENPVSDRNQAS